MYAQKRAKVWVMSELGLWKHFHWRILLRWGVLAVLLSILLGTGAIAISLDGYALANICFKTTAALVFSKTAHLAITAEKEVWWQRMLFTFLLFGIFGVGIVESVRVVNQNAARKRDRHEASDSVSITAPDASAGNKNNGETTNASTNTSPTPRSTEISDAPSKIDGSNAGDVHPEEVHVSMTIPPSPIRVSMEKQTAMLRSWIQQTNNETGVEVMWLSQIFQRPLDGIPGGPDVDVPAALRQLQSNGEVMILETAPRPFMTWWRETFPQDIKFKILKIPEKIRTTSTAPDVALPNIRIASQKKVASTDPDRPVAMEVVIQTDMEVKPTALVVHFNGNIVGGKYEIRGGQQPSRMVTLGDVMPDGKSFYFQFFEPGFEPEAPIVVTVFSKSEVKAIKVERITPLTY